jgi:hypothetical protein
LIFRQRFFEFERRLHRAAYAGGQYKLRKLTYRLKEWHRRRAQREARSHARRPAHTMGARRAAAFQVFQAARALLPEPRLIYDERPGCCVLKPPAALDLVENYDETLAFLMEIRGRPLQRPIAHPDNDRPLRLFTDFAALRTIAPGTGLVLAAEIDRRRLATGGKPTSWDEEWDPSVRAYFDQAGLFDLLGIKAQHNGAAVETTSDLQAVRFVRGRSVKGASGAALRDQLEALCGKKIGPRRTVYEAISEAIANTRHAYPPDVAIWPTKATGSWWAAGTWNSATDVVSLQIYDQGVGIPATLPRSEHWSNIVKLAGLGEKLHPERTDARLIEAALEVGRTSTGQQGRGKGLAEMASWVDKLGNEYEWNFAAGSVFWYFD